MWRAESGERNKLIVKDLIKKLLEFPMDSEITMSGVISKSEIDDTFDYIPFGITDFDFSIDKEQPPPQRLFVTLKDIEILPF